MTKIPSSQARLTGYDSVAEYVLPNEDHLEGIFAQIAFVMDATSACNITAAVNEDARS
jgi:hypothetical protein